MSHGPRATVFAVTILLLVCEPAGAEENSELHRYAFKDSLHELEKGSSGMLHTITFLTPSIDVMLGSGCFLLYHHVRYSKSRLILLQRIYLVVCWFVYLFLCAPYAETNTFPIVLLALWVHKCLPMYFQVLIDICSEEKGYGEDEVVLKVVDLGMQPSDLLILSRLAESHVTITAKGENYGPKFLRLNSKGKS